MTLGHWLDRANSACSAAVHAAAGRCEDHGQAATALAARERVYSELLRLTSLATGVLPPADISRRHASWLANNLRRAEKAGPATMLISTLRASTWRGPPPAPAAERTELSRALDEAADALGVAADIVASHVDHLRQPRTVEGQAVVRGAGRDAALADIAALTLRIRKADVATLSWLRRRRDRTLAVTYADALKALTWSADVGVTRVLRRIASRPGQAVLRLLEVAPPGRPETVQSVTSWTDLTGVIERLRAWLAQAPRQAGPAHVAAAARLAALVTAAGIRAEVAGEGLRQALAQWQTVRQAMRSVAQLEAVAPDAALRQVTAAADWIRRNWPAHERNLSPADREQVRIQVGLLPGVADGLYRAVRSASEHGTLFVASVGLADKPAHGVFHVRATWAPPEPDDEVMGKLIGTLVRLSVDDKVVGTDGTSAPASVAAQSFPSAPSQRTSGERSAAGVSGFRRESRRGAIPRR